MDPELMPGIKLPIPVIKPLTNDKNPSFFYILFYILVRLLFKKMSKYVIICVE